MSFKKKVLIVHSEETELESFIPNLREIYDITISRNMRDVDLKQYDLIVLDTNQNPESFVYCRYIRKRTKQTPILMLSEICGVAGKMTALESGANDYLVSPCGVEELATRMSMQLE